MTEREWLDCTDPTPLLGFLRGRVSDRKRRLFAVACCRRIWPLLSGEGGRQLVEAAEPVAEGSADARGLIVQAASVSAGGRHSRFRHAAEAARRVAMPAGILPTPSVALHARAARESDPDHAEDEGSAQSHLLHDLLGNPFRPVALDPAWLTPTVTALAQAAYEERILRSGELEAERLSVLADALEEAGCSEAEILTHLRGPGPHVRGCWAVDLVLGRE
jgi:hypothetical protein